MKTYTLTELHKAYYQATLKDNDRFVRVDDLEKAKNNIKNKILKDYDLKDAILLGALLDNELSQSNPGSACVTVVNIRSIGSRGKTVNVQNESDNNSVDVNSTSGQDTRPDMQTEIDLIKSAKSGRDIIVKRCDEHGLYLYRDGSVYMCKLGCKYEMDEMDGLEAKNDG